jgi:hypothetical protein
MSDSTQLLHRSRDQLQGSELRSDGSQFIRAICKCWLPLAAPASLAPHQKASQARIAKNAQKLLLSQDNDNDAGPTFGLTLKVVGTFEAKNAARQMTLIRLVGGERLELPTLSV